MLDQNVRSAPEVMRVATRMTGLDIATTCVRGAELLYAKDRFVLERFAQMPLPVGAVVQGEVADPQAVATAIKMLWKRGRFKNRAVSIGVAGPQVLVRRIEIPFVAEQDRRRYLPRLTADQVPLAAEGAVMDFVALDTLQEPGVPPRSSGLLAAAAEQPVTSAIAAVELAGLGVTDVDVTPFAAVRSLCDADPIGIDMRTEVIVDVGASTTCVAVHRNGIPLSADMLMIGGQDITARLMAELGVNLPTAESLKREALLDDPYTRHAADSPNGVISEGVDTLVAEIRTSVQHYLDAYPRASLGRIALTGGGSLVAGLASRLRRATGLPVERGRCLLRLGSGRSGLSEDHLLFADPMSAVAVGLAIRST